ncbi:MAG: ABC transporter ATP-binding protein [Deltaproteobacteria bacterium]|nr:ABC transporter ATP-binding protein [Deltaproteobacteria bacterium]
MAFFEVRDIVKYFGGLAAVNRVSFEVQEGQIYGLIGPNGSGKTTIFNLINGYFHLNKGQIWFQGEKISGLKTHQICQRGIGRTFQVVKPLKRMTVLDNVIASAFLRHHSRAEAQAWAEATIHFCGLTHFKDKVAKSLPIASRKRLEIARSLATRPKLILLDETAAGLNPHELEEAIALIKKIRDSGITVIIVEHIMKVIMSISDRIVAINHGMVITEGTPTEVASNPEVIKAYFGEDYRA